MATLALMARGKILHLLILAALFIGAIHPHRHRPHTGPRTGRKPQSAQL